MIKIESLSKLFNGSQLENPGISGESRWFWMTFDLNIKFILCFQPPATISQVELYDKQQQEARADFGSNKGLQSMSDMKKRLEAFKAAKNVNKSLQDKISKSKGSSPDVIEVNDLFT